MAPSNIAVLTRSHNIIASKKKAKREQVKEIVFDDVARREFLTGFHKRKVEKKEKAKEKAKEREKQERLEARRERRIMLTEQAKRNVEEAEKAYGGIPEGESDSEWDGLGASSSKGKMRENEEEQEEYEDEEQLATVTVVEEFDPDTLIHGAPPPRQSQGDGNEDDGVFEGRTLDIQPRPKTKTKHPAAGTTLAKTLAKISARTKDVKYETSAARKVERTKQRHRKLEKAERAGGKSSRKRTSGGKRSTGGKR